MRLISIRSQQLRYFICIAYQFSAPIHDQQTYCQYRYYHNQFSSGDFVPASAQRRESIHPDLRGKNSNVGDQREMEAIFGEDEDMR